MRPYHYDNKSIASSEPHLRLSPPVRRPGLVDHHLRWNDTVAHPRLLPELLPDVAHAGAVGPEQLSPVLPCGDSADPLPESPGRRSGRWKFLRRPDSPKRRGCERKLSRVPLFRQLGSEGRHSPGPNPFQFASSLFCSPICSQSGVNSRRHGRGRIGLLTGTGLCYTLLTTYVAKEKK